MELYIHIPFCAQKCRYCDFASYAGMQHLMPAYVDALLQEAADQSASLSHQCMDTVFLGGGTPSLLPAAELMRLVKGVREHFPITSDAEFTSEANPGTLTPHWLDAAVQSGVNRLSLGMQAYQPRLLETLGRIHHFDQVESSVRMARAAGIGNISLDLMFGLPGQTLADWQETLEAALSLEPEHLSCYGLIPEEGTPLTDDLHSGLLSLPEESEERAMYDYTLKHLAQHGFEQYEISNFAKPGRACRHNIGYWRQIPYLGLGAAASSMLPANGTHAYTRLTNPASLQEYLRMVGTKTYSLRESLPVTHQEAQFETMMLALRTTQGVSEAAFQSMHGISLESRYGPQLHALEAQGLLLHHQGWWRLTRRGMDVQNAILVELMDD